MSVQDVIINYIHHHAEIDQIISHPGNRFQKIIRFFNSKDKKKIEFYLGRMAYSTSTDSSVLNVSEKLLSCFCIEYSAKLKANDLENEEKAKFVQPIQFNNNKKTNFDLLLGLSNSYEMVSKLNPREFFCNTFSFDIRKEPHTVTNFNCSVNSNKENLHYSTFKNLQKKDRHYDILYDQAYSGIIKRNTSEVERQKYIIIISNIINGRDPRTTVMIKNIPTFISQVELLEKINKNYSTAYNFFYLPIDFNKQVNAGFAFINFKSAKLIINFFQEFDTRPWNFQGSLKKIGFISYARIQGFRSICEHFEKSNIMNQVDDKVKPIIILD